MLLSYHHFSSYLIGYILCSIICLCHHIFLCLGWWFFVFQCVKDSHILFHSYLMDIGSKIFSWEGHFFIKSLYTSLFESISISLCILKRTHLLIFRVCAGKRKKNEKKIGNKRMYTVSSSIECIYWSLRLLYWVSWLWKFICEFSDVLFSLCLSHYIFYMWEMGNLFLGTSILFSPSLHSLIIWLFSMTWFEYISAHSFSFDLFVLYFIRLAYIVFCSYRFTFRVQYFPHIILVHPIDSSIFFFFSFITDIFILDFFFLTNTFILNSLRSMTYEIFLYILHFIHEGMRFDHWVFEPSFPSFLSSYHHSLRYVLVLKTKAMTSCIVFDNTHVGDA